MVVKSCKDAVFYENPSIAKIKKESGELKTNAMLSAILMDLVMSFNVGKTMNEHQIVQGVALLQQEYYFLKPSELKYCFNNAKLGRYGVTYDRIDMPIIFGWIEKYMDERLNTVMEKNEHEHELIKNKGTEQTEFIQNMLTDTRFAPSGSETIKSDTPMPSSKYIPRERTKQEQLVQDIFIEFDKLLSKENDITGEMNNRFLTYAGKKVTISEYLEIKLLEQK